MAKKKTAKKTAKKAKKPAKKTGAKRKPNAAFMKAMTPSSQLAAIVGPKALPRTEVTKKIWAYIKKNNLQDKVERRNIHADDKLKPIFGKKTVNMFEMTKLVNKHLS
jgi:chromatin remodeling complex protein RSC6